MALKIICQLEIEKQLHNFGTFLVWIASKGYDFHSDFILPFFPIRL